MRCSHELLLGLLGLASGRALGCDYEDPVTEMQTYPTLDQDLNAFDEDTCNSNCCDDTACDMYQWTDQDENYQPACWRGAASTDGTYSTATWTTMRKQSGGGGGGGLPSFPGFGGHSGRSGSDWGYSFLFWFSLGTVLYVGGGMGYAYKVQEKRGMDMLPHREFWGNLAGLVSDGIHFSKQEFDRRMAERAAAREGYTDIGGGGGEDVESDPPPKKNPKKKVPAKQQQVADEDSDSTQD